MNRFFFSDSSGLIKNDRFFGIGLLSVENVGLTTALLETNYQMAYTAQKNNKNTAIDYLIKSSREDEVIKILKKNRCFEMKFDYLSQSSLPFYQRMLNIFLNNKNNRFSAMVIDRQHPSFDGRFIQDTWDSFINYLTSLILREMSNLQEDKFCFIVDEITKPKTKMLSFENALLEKIKSKIPSYNYKTGSSIKFENIFGILSIKSNSNHLLQLVDVLIGSVMYDFKKKVGLTSEKVENKKEILVQEIRTTLGVADLAHDLTKHSPVYFSVFEAKWKKDEKTP